MLYPMTVEAAALQERVTECVAGTPVPVKVMVAGEFAALLVTVTLPFTPTAVAGVKLALSVTVCPGVTVCPVETPLAANPAPETLMLEMVTLEFPAFVNVTLRPPLLPSFTVPKLRLVVLAFRTKVAGFTVSPAALLVTLPTLLVTVTVNCSPLSAEAVAGVV
jgi:hypothetical protein